MGGKVLWAMEEDKPTMWCLLPRMGRVVLWIPSCPVGTYLGYHTFRDSLLLLVLSVSISFSFSFFTTAATP